MNKTIKRDSFESRFFYYDILTYLPEDIKTIQGENILTDDFNMGAYSIVVLKNMPAKDILRLEEDIKNKIENVELCASVADLTGEDRHYDNTEEFYETAKQDLDLAVIKILKHTIN